MGEEILKLVNVHKGDPVYDHGCGDGRIVITAPKRFGARAVGIDIYPDMKISGELGMRF